LKTYFLSIFSLAFPIRCRFIPLLSFHSFSMLSQLNTLYIPRVARAHMGHAEYMKRVFDHQQYAVIKSVEFFEHEIPNAAFGFAIVKVLFWIPGPISKHFQQRLQDSSRETRIVFSDPSYWIVLPYSEKQKRNQKKIYKIPPPPLPLINTTNTNNCICGCGGGELDCSSQILYNRFTDNIWTQQSSDSCRTDDWSYMNNMEDNFRFYDTPHPFDMTV